MAVAVLCTIDHALVLELLEVAIFAEDAPTAAQADEHQELDLDAACLAVLVECHVSEAALLEVTFFSRTDSLVVELVEQVPDFGIAQDSLLAGQRVQGGDQHEAVLGVGDLGPLVVIVELLVGVAVPQGALLAEKLRGVALAAEPDQLVGSDHHGASAADGQGLSVLAEREELLHVLLVQQR